MKNDLVKFRLLERNAKLATLNVLLRDTLEKTDDLLFNEEFLDNEDTELVLLLRRNMESLQAYHDIVIDRRSKSDAALEAL